MPLSGEIPPPPPTAPMPSFPPPGGPVPPPPGPPSGPYPGPGPGPFPGPVGPPPGGGSNSTPLILAIVGIIAVIGIIFAVVSGGDDDDDGTATGGTPGAQTDDGDTGGIPLPDDLDDGTDTPEPEETLPPVTDPPPEPAEAAVTDCVSVDSAGTFLGTGSCSDGGATYEVIEVVDGSGVCSSSEVGSIISGDYRLCLQPHLLETYCYDFGLDASDVMNGWITPAGECELPGTVHVIDIVPGITDNGADYCTNEYEWDLWYGFDVPQMVVCIKKY